MRVVQIAYRVQIFSAMLAAVFFASGLMAVGLTTTAQHRIVPIAVVKNTTVVPKGVNSSWDQVVNRDRRSDRLVDMDLTPSPPQSRERPFVVPAPWQTVVKEYEI